MIRKPFNDESKADWVDRIKLIHSAQDIHDEIMRLTDNNPGTSPGYSKTTLAKILYHLK